MVTERRLMEEKGCNVISGVPFEIFCAEIKETAAELVP
jgi:hypothetical protein